MRNIIIFGDSPFAERMAKYILSESREKLLGFTQEDAFCKANNLLGYPVVPLSQLRDTFLEEFEILIAIGYIKMNNLRESVFNLLIREGFKVGSWVSANAIVYSKSIGEGTIVLPNTMIGPGCTIGKCNFIAASVTLSHDNMLGDFNFFSTGVVLGGGAIVKHHCFLGLSSIVKSGVVLEDYTLLGMGCNMLRNSGQRGRAYIGNPAKLLEKYSMDLTI